MGAVAEAATDVFGHPVTVSSLLEQRATKAQKAAKIDIVDLIFSLPLSPPKGEGELEKQRTGTD